MPEGDRLPRLAAQECGRCCLDCRHDDGCASDGEPRIPEDEAPVGLQRPNARPQPSGVGSEEYFQHHPADRQSDPNDSQEQYRGMPPPSRCSWAAGNGDDRNADQEKQRGTKETENDETRRAAFGEVGSSRRGETNRAAQCPEQMEAREQEAPHRCDSRREAPPCRACAVHGLRTYFTNSMVLT